MQNTRDTGTLDAFYRIFRDVTQATGGACIWMDSMADEHTFAEYQRLLDECGREEPAIEIRAETPQRGYRRIRLS